ncbi:putative membrane-bound acyltransferase YfiQ [Lentibacillus kapialis]|uniref:Membrane-bound acyltransferase YfiQ n=1 Tax=Lentibacillus kapialis TaxID=340214 RepID=A0A917PP42_9BACI|nr:acyltransferase family protein [Lentibacillus kapialis]GGJ85921.1 putative membrane-bound acyltransferase YfiQ [Lentibacillus kapialis]
MGQGKKVINEIFFLRTIACLAVVFLHAISSSLLFADGHNETMLRIVQLFLMFGTPTFVFISELLLANSYQDKIPNGFFSKRVKFILTPYIIMAIIYAWFNLWNANQLTISSFVSDVIGNVLGGYHGYFVLIIFQFYILHFIFQKYIAHRYSPWLILGVSLIINIGYLGIFNVLRLPPSANEHILNFWNDGFKLLFFGWIFYFAVAFYCGRNYDLIKHKVTRNAGKIITVLALSVSLLMFDYFILGFESIHSKRFDIVFYTMSIIGILIYLASKMNKVPNLVMLISRYSFGIYLLHPLLISLIVKYGLVPNDNLILYIAITFLVTVSTAVFLTFLLNKSRIGVYVVGKVKNTAYADKKGVKKNDGLGTKNDTQNIKSAILAVFLFGGE